MFSEKKAKDFFSEVMKWNKSIETVTMSMFHGTLKSRSGNQTLAAEILQYSSVIFLTGIYPRFLGHFFPLTDFCFGKLKRLVDFWYEKQKVESISSFVVTESAIKLRVGMEN